MSKQHHPKIIHENGAILAQYIGDTFKALDDTRFSGHAIRWHNPERKDLQGEWFSAKTYLMRNAGYPVVGIPTNYQHGRHKGFGNLAIGLVTFADERELGLFIEGELKTREQYIEMLREIGRKADVRFTDSQLRQKSEMMDKAVREVVSSIPLQFSGGFDPATWIGDKSTGHIDQAGMIHLAFTPTPADDLNPMVQFKSVVDEFLKVESVTSYSLPNQSTDDSTDRKGHMDAKGDMDAPENEPAQANVQQSEDESEISKGSKSMKNLEEILAMLSELESALTAYGQDMGMENEDAMAMADETIAEAGKMEDEEEIKSITPEQLAEKAFTILQGKIEERQKNARAVQDAFAKHTQEALKNLPGKSDLPEYTNHGINGNGQKGLDNRAGMGGIIQHSRYRNWDARDFSFALNLAQLQGSSNKRLMKVGFDEKFFREFADKATKSYQENQLALNEGAIKSVMAIKSDELDYSTQDAYGDEFVPTIWSDDVWLRPRQDNVIQNVFDSIEMPSNPYEYPVESTDPTVYFVAETKHEAQLSLDSTTRPIPSSKVGTQKVTFTAKKFGLQVQWSSELEEDSIARLVPQFRQQAERAMQDKGIDNVALNGDPSTTTNINSDGETITATTRNYLAYEGLIHQALVTATTNKLDAGGATPTLSHLRSTRSLLGVPEAYNPANLAWIMDWSTYAKLLSLDEVVTVDKYGDRATVLTGELAKVDGIPVFVSAEMALADADGKITDGGNVVNRGRGILVHRPTWKMGYRREVTQSLDFLPWYDAWILTITMRNHFLPRTATDGTLQSTDDSTAILYNIGV